MTGEPSTSDVDRCCRLQFVILVLIAVVVFVLAIAPIVTPDPPAPGASDAIDLDAAVGHVEVIASSPHPMGTAALDRVRRYLANELRGIGLDPQMQAVTAPDYFGSPGRRVDIVNVMARIEGTGDGDAILLMAHYDTVPATPGANDNSAAVAALLEAARVVVSEPPLRNDVIVLFTDGEEPTPRFGASAFTEHPWFADVVMAVNFEGIGEGGPSLLIEMAGPPADMISGYATAVTKPVAFSFMTEIADLIGGAASDFDVIREASLPGFNVAFFRGSAIYHTEYDTPQRLHVDGMAHHGAIALGIVRHFGAEDLAAAEDTGDTVFFTVPGYRLVRHPAGTLWFVLVAGLGLSAWGLRRRSLTIGSRGSGLRGLGVVVAGSLVAAIVVTVVWTFLIRVRPTMGIPESYAYLGVLGLITAGLWERVRAIARRWRADTTIGIFALWGFLAIGATLAAPALGYLFVWGLLAGGIAISIRSLWGDHLFTRAIALAVAAVPVVVLTVPFVDTMFLLAGPRPGNPDSDLSTVITVAVFVAYAALALVTSIVERWFRFAEPVAGQSTSMPPETAEASHA